MNEWMNERSCHLDFLHAVGHRLPGDALNRRSQTLTLEGVTHGGALPLLTAGQHAPAQNIWVAGEDKTMVTS